MINTPPSHRPQVAPAPSPSRKPPSMLMPDYKIQKTRFAKIHTADLSEQDPYLADLGAGGPSVTYEGQRHSDSNTAVALAHLHSWDSDYVSLHQRVAVRETCTYAKQEGYPEPDIGHGLPSIHDTLPPFQPTTRELLPSVLPSPTGRYASLPPIYRRDKMQRPRKPSMGQNARKGKHERGKSKDFSLKEFSRRLSEEGRKAMSAEPPTAAWMQGKRWEDLIEAATTATEVDDDRDLTPVSQMTFFDCPLFTCCCQEIEIL